MTEQSQKTEIDTQMGERFPVLGGDVLAFLVLMATRGRVLVGSFGDHQYIRVECTEGHEKDAKCVLDGLKKPWAPVNGQPPFSFEALVAKYEAQRTVRGAYAALRVDRDRDAHWNIHAPAWTLPEKTEEVAIPVISFVLPVPAVTDPDFSRLSRRANKVQEDLNKKERELMQLALEVARGRLLSQAMEARITAMTKASAQVREGAHTLRQLHANVPIDGGGRVTVIASLSDDKLADIEQRLGIVNPSASSWRWWSNKDRAQAICAREDGELTEALRYCLSGEQARQLARMLGYQISAEIPTERWCQLVAEFR
ncbi:MAG: hypothetical protein WC817_00695 [Patescibacteria group bacterium]|jgi:hypothetical protein